MFGDQKSGLVSTSAQDIINLVLFLLVICLLADAGKPDDGGK
jgi:hypothetical protein